MSDRQQIFVCDRHRFIVVVDSRGASCTGSPGVRTAGCDECEQVVDDAWRAMGWPEKSTADPAQSSLFGGES